MPKLSEKHKRQQNLMAVIEAADFVNEGEVMDLAIALDQLTKAEQIDLEGWVQYCDDIGTRSGYMVSIMGHDIHGIVRFRDKPEEGFSPKTAGYAKYKKEMSDA